MQESEKITYNIYLITLKDTEFSSESKIGVISDKIDKDNNELSTKLYKKKNLKKVYNEIIYEKSKKRNGNMACSF